MAQEKNSSSSPAASAPLSGISSPVTQELIRRGLPVTRTNWLNLAYPEGAPNPLPAELEAQVREALAEASLPEGYNQEGVEESLAWQKHRLRQRLPLKGPKSS